jgi:cytochrome c biogenesis protein CcmG, thiol:disulfide interchange protein DsbE
MKSNNMKKFFFITLVFCLPLFIFACGQAPALLKVGDPAPDFSLKDRKGKTWILSELKGQVVLVNFWATWCPPCREEMPSMQKLYARLPGDNFKMLAILNKDKPALADFVATQIGFTIPILNDQDNQVSSNFSIIGLPETFIIDKQGILREKFIGPVKWDSPGSIQMLMKYINQ